MKRVLVVEPYYGGSHKVFLDGLCRHVDGDFTLLTLPARKWKMRMQLSAAWFAEQVAARRDRCFDVVLCSTFVDVAVLKALLVALPGWSPETRFCTYFHENQFVYPSQVPDPSRFQFTAINFNTAVVSDRVAFNSRYNYRTFLEHSSAYLKKAADMCLDRVLADIREKAAVLYPGLDFSLQDGTEGERDEGVPVVCWNHRWEHDKGPERFFEAMAWLKRRGYRFRLIVLGQSYASQPAVFDWAREYFQEEIDHFGYVECRRHYFHLLRRCDIAVSTALHEFFGISVIEAVRAGCLPLVPERLSYPELYPARFRYNEAELEEKLAEMLAVVARRGAPEVPETESFSWTALAPRYQRWLFN